MDEVVEIGRGRTEQSHSLLRHLEDVVLETDGLVVELGTTQSAVETRALQNLLLLLLPAPQVGERVQEEMSKMTRAPNIDSYGKGKQFH